MRRLRPRWWMLALVALLLVGELQREHLAAYAAARHRYQTSPAAVAVYRHALGAYHRSLIDRRLVRVSLRAG